MHGYIRPELSLVAGTKKLSSCQFLKKTFLMKTVLGWFTVRSKVYEPPWSAPELSLAKACVLPSDPGFAIVGRHLLTEPLEKIRIKGLFWASSDFVHNHLFLAQLSCWYVKAENISLRKNYATPLFYAITIVLNWGRIIFSVNFFVAVARISLAGL